MIQQSEELDRLVSAFERAWTAGPPELGDFLPPASNPDRARVLTELVRVDMEFRRARGIAASLDRYRASFPALFDDLAAVRELAFEEYRLRAAAGELAHPREYAAKYGIDTAGWPAPRLTPSATTAVVPYPAPGAAEPADARPRLPALGETVEGFRLVSELGRGSFGRVYLAEQVGLSGRRVALKLSARFGASEPETLARLQHTHIVPVYSTHRAGPFQLTVMPYLGAATLADLRGRKERPASGRELVDTLLVRRGDTVSKAGTGDAPPPAADADVARRTLARFTYPDAVLWIGARLAEALAHAHDRGILHRDVKPANVLLTDDGVPMLLDFNLAADAAGDRSRAGGTPAYMAPEQLRALAGLSVTPDGRADVFSLGVVLFELLAGRHPFPPPGDGPPDPNVLLSLRPAAPPKLRGLNPAVSPSVEAIIKRCLEPDPARRYASARDLADDLDRQLTHRPLAHTREPYLRERATKWARRHPRLTSASSVAALALLVLGAVVGAFAVRQAHLGRLEAASAWVAVRDEREPIRSRVLGKDLPAAVYVEAADRAAAALAPFAATDDPNWADGKLFRRLPEENRGAARRDVAFTLTYLADARAWQAAREPGRRAELLEAALTANERASAVPDAAVATRVRLQRAALLRAAGRPSDPPPDAAPADAEARAWAALSAGRYREVVDALEPLTREPARVFTAWQAMGDAYLHLGETSEAVRCLDVAAALAPDEPAVAFLRGLALMEAGRHRHASTAFDRVLAKLPNDPETLLNRAICRVALDDSVGAIADLDRLERGAAPPPRLHFVREQARRAAGQHAAADRDRTQGIAKEPADPLGWVARGRARLRQSPPDVPGALADFRQAVEADPQCRVGWENLAELYSERLSRPADAVRALDRVLAISPGHLPSRAGRAVLHARAGRRTEARADADACPCADADPLVLYQLACAYLLTADGKADRERGVGLLRACLRKDQTWARMMPTDPDLKCVHGSPEFDALIAAATALAR